MVPFAAAGLLSLPWAREDSKLDLLLDGAAWLLFVAGATFRWWATLYVGGRKEGFLVKDGPYSICRNPLYLGTFLLIAAITVFVHSITFALGLMVASFYYLGITVSSEERTLRHKFGEDYDQYCRQTPRLFPRFMRLRAPSLIEVRLSGVIAEYFRTLRWVWIPFLAEAVAHLRTETWWPHVFHFP